MGPSATLAPDHVYWSVGWLVDQFGFAERIPEDLYFVRPVMPQRWYPIQGQVMVEKKHLSEPLVVMALVCFSSFP